MFRSLRNPYKDETYRLKAFVEPPKNPNRHTAIGDMIRVSHGQVCQAKKQIRQTLGTTFPMKRTSKVIVTQLDIDRGIPNCTSKCVVGNAGRRLFPDCRFRMNKNGITIQGGSFKR